MTGLDCLRNELKARGFTDLQVNSKVVAGVLDIVANTDRYSKLKEEEDSYTERIKELEREENRLNHQIRGLNEDIRRKQNALKALDSEIQEIKGYIDAFNEGLAKCETPEERDIMRKIQVFVNSVSVDTKYDNTAYIIGLATIMSNGSIKGIDALKSVNTKLFDKIGRTIL